MYGYVTDNYAQYDVVEISHDLLLEVAGETSHKSDKAWASWEEHLDKLGVLDDGYAIPRPGPGDVQRLEDAVPEQLQLLLRGLCAREAPDRRPRPPTITAEEAALLQMVLLKRSAGYETGYELDQVIQEALRSGLALPNLSIPPDCDAHRLSMALQVRMGEKEILRQLILLTRTHIQQKAQESTAASSKRKHNDHSDRGPSKKTARKGQHRG
jgi:SET domain-containing protein 6